MFPLQPRLRNTNHLGTSPNINLCFIHVLCITAHTLHVVRCCSDTACCVLQQHRCCAATQMLCSDTDVVQQHRCCAATQVLCSDTDVVCCSDIADFFLIHLGFGHIPEHSPCFMRYPHTAYVVRRCSDTADLFLIHLGTGADQTTVLLCSCGSEIIQGAVCVLLHCGPDSRSC